MWYRKPLRCDTEPVWARIWQRRKNGVIMRAVVGLSRVARGEKKTKDCEEEKKKSLMIKAQSEQRYW